MITNETNASALGASGPVDGDTGPTPMTEAEARAREVLAEIRGPSASQGHVRAGDADRVVNIDVAIRAMLAFAASQPATPPAQSAGVVLVPREPTDEIIDAMRWDGCMMSKVGLRRAYRQLVEKFS